MDFNYGYSPQVTPTPNQFTVPTGMGVQDQGYYNALSSYGMPSPTQGANTDIASAATQSPGMLGIQGLGANIPTLQLGLGGLSTLANLYGGLKSLGLAQDSFNFQKTMAQKNYANSVQNYNTSLTDRANVRAAVEGQTPAQAAAYVNANKLS